MPDKTLQITCPKCKNTIEIEESMVLRKETCPYCHHNFIIPKKYHGILLMELLNVDVKYSIYRGEDTTLERKNIVKILHAASMNQKESTQTAFFEIIRKVAPVNNPGVVPILTCGDDGGDAYLVTNFADGMNLQQKSESLERPPSFDEILSLSEHLCAILKKMASEKIYHGHLTPENIFINSENHLLISDFGLAVALEKDQQRNPYCSPECRIKPQAALQNDLFSLGACLYEYAAGNRLCNEEKTAEVVSDPRILKPLKEIRSDIPELYSDLIMQMLSIEPESRPNSYDILEIVLESVKKNTAAKNGKPKIVLPSAQNRRNAISVVACRKAQIAKPRARTPRYKTAVMLMILIILFLMAGLFVKKYEDRLPSRIQNLYRTHLTQKQSSPSVSVQEDSQTPEKEKVRQIKRPKESPESVEKVVIQKDFPTLQLPERLQRELKEEAGKNDAHKTAEKNPVIPFVLSKKWSTLRPRPEDFNFMNEKDSLHRYYQEVPEKYRAIEKERIHYLAKYHSYLCSKLRHISYIPEGEESIEFKKGFSLHGSIPFCDEKKVKIRIKNGTQTSLKEFQWSELTQRQVWKIAAYYITTDSQHYTTLTPRKKAEIFEEYFYILLFCDWYEDYKSFVLYRERALKIWPDGQKKLVPFFDASLLSDD
ncbi:MAG: protein kinase [Lentisphaeria bacterium]